MSPRFMRDSEPSSPVIELFCEEVAAHDDTSGRNHVPEWEETPTGLKALLENTIPKFHHNLAASTLPS